jgi:hypothetical protein
MSALQIYGGGCVRRGNVGVNEAAGCLMKDKNARQAEVLVELGKVQDFISALYCLPVYAEYGSVILKEVEVELSLD